MPSPGQGVTRQQKPVRKALAGTYKESGGAPLCHSQGRQLKPFTLGQVRKQQAEALSPLVQSHSLEL